MPLLTVPCSSGGPGRGPRSQLGPRPAVHAVRYRSCGVANHDGVVNQIGPSGAAHGSSELVKAHTDSPAQWEAKAQARHRLVSWPSESRDSDMGQGIRSCG